ncbi:hypothetical protein F4805DRAFT_424100 [Annulohypoxylon moriforme]|nr:hypothetical protein F4805DRAFT_424100 [Annulohypoxylon moriforme]
MAQHVVATGQILVIALSVSSLCRKTGAACADGDAIIVGVLLSILNFVHITTVNWGAFQI